MYFNFFYIFAFNVIFEIILYFLCHSNKFFVCICRTELVRVVELVLDLANGSRGKVQFNRQIVVGLPYKTNY